MNVKRANSSHVTRLELTLNLDVVELVSVARDQQARSGVEVRKVSTVRGRGEVRAEKYGERAQQDQKHQGLHPSDERVGSSSHGEHAAESIEGVAESLALLSRTLPPGDGFLVILVSTPLESGLTYTGVRSHGRENDKPSS